MNLLGVFNHVLYVHVWCEIRPIMPPKSVHGASYEDCFNLRPAGGCLNTHPLRFFADSKKTAARSAAGFSPTLSPIFLAATFVKVSILGHARSGHQVRSSDHTLQKLYNRAPATVFEGKLWNFRNMIRSSVPTKCISWIFDIGDLRSGHFRDLPITYKSMGKNYTPCFMLHLELTWMESHQVRYLLILQVKFLVGDLSKGHGGHSRSPTVFYQ